jgi:type I restriction enzyme S subunit
MGSVCSGKALAVNAPGARRPYLRTVNVLDGAISVDDVLHMPMTEAEFTRFRLLPGDALLNEGQTTELVGRCALYRDELGRPVAIQNQLLRFRADSSTSADFAVHLFRQCQKDGTFAAIATQTTSVAHLGLKRFANLSLAWPATKAEQEAIAEALSDVDALIEALEQLIAKKRSIKRGVMQALLTGRRRLPGFEVTPGLKQTEVGVIPVEWECRSIDTVLDEISMGPFGSDIKVSNFVSAGVPVLSGANMKGTRVLDAFRNYVSPAKAKSLKKAVASRGDVVVTHRGTLGQIAYIPHDSKYENYVISQSQFRARFSERVCPVWIVLFFRSRKGSRILLEGKGHTGVPAIAQATTTFRRLKVPLPSLAEQEVIAQILSDHDAEIEALQARLKKTRQLKQGMAQQLLTGRIRLV